MMNMIYIMNTYNALQGDPFYMSSHKNNTCFYWINSQFKHEIYRTFTTSCHDAHDLLSRNTGSTLCLFNVMMFGTMYTTLYTIYTRFTTSLGNFFKILKNSWHLLTCHKMPATTPFQLKTFTMFITMFMISTSTSNALLGPLLKLARWCKIVFYY